MADFICPECGEKTLISLGYIIPSCKKCGATFTETIKIYGVHIIHGFPLFVVDGKSEEYTTIPHAMAMGRGTETKELADRFNEAWENTFEIREKFKKDE